MIKKGLFRLGIFFLYLISLLPFWILYLIADFLFVILYYVIGYRRKVVQENLRNAFPSKTVQERSIVEKKYYKYLADLIVETVKMISISEAEMSRRVVCTNPEIIDHYFSRGKSISAVAGHYCNWEWAGSEFSISNPLFIIYKP